MGVQSKFAQSWAMAGLLPISLIVASTYFFGVLNRDPYVTTNDLGILVMCLSFPLLLSAGLNALYDARCYSQTQRAWMLSPKSLLGKIGYTVSGAAALILLFILGLFLAVLIGRGLLSLGQGAWQS